MPAYWYVNNNLKITIKKEGGSQNLSIFNPRQPQMKTL